MRLLIPLLMTILAAPVSALERPSDLANGDILLGEQASRPQVEREGAYEPLLLTIDSPYQVFDAAGSLISVAAWAPDGRPAAGADVYIADEFIGRTTADGAFAFRWGVPANDVRDYWRSGAQVSVVWEDDDQVRAGAVWFNAMSRTESFASDHLFVYADRGVLAPGDTLNARIVAWHLAADYEPVEDRAVELLLTGPDGDVFSGVEVQTDEFGTAHASLDLPPSLADGLYQLHVAYEGATASTNVRIERFVPPAFEVVHDLPRFLQRDASELVFELELNSFDQVPVDGGTVSVDLLAAGEVRWSRSQPFDGPGPHRWVLEDETLLAWTEGVADRSPLAVRLTVEDQDGRVSQITRDLTYAVNPYIAVIEADRDAWSTGDQAQLIARVTDVERVPLRNTELRMVTSDGETFTETTDSSGTAQFSIEMGDRGFDVELFAPDVDAPIARHSLVWQPAQPMRSLIEDAIVREHETTSVRVTFPSSFVPAERVVHMDVTDVSGSIVNAVLLTIEETDGEFVATGEFSAPSWGSMLLTFFCLGRDDQMERVGLEEGPSQLGLLTEGQNLVVHPGRELQVELTGDVGPVAPGAAFDATIEVRNADGEPVDAALGVSLVDAALVSLKDPLEITPMDHFYNPELRTISTTGAAILTWPVVSRNWGGQTHDIALPPFDFKPGGNVALGRSGGEFGALEMDEDGTVMEMATGMGMGMAGGAVGSSAPGAPAMDMMMASPMAEMEPDEPYFMEEGGNRQARADEPADEPVIEIRFETPQTAYWNPTLQAERGTADLHFDAPDSIAPHVLTVVASDTEGGVTVFRTTVDVTQPVSVASQIPNGLAVGESAYLTATVSNRTADAVSGIVSVASDALSSDTRVELTVPSFGATTVQLPFSVDAAGEGEALVTFDGDGAADAVQTSFFAVPRGIPSNRVVQGEWEDGVWSAAVGPADGYREVGLSVTFPALTASFAGADKLLERIESEPLDRLAFDLTTAITLLPYRSDAHVWRPKIQSSLDRLVALQGDDGSWGTWWSAGGSPQLTTWLMTALIEGQAGDFSVSSDAIRAAADYLLDALEGEFDVGAFAWWEGGTDAVVSAARFETLHVLSRAAAVLTDAQRDRLESQAGSALDYLDEGSPALLAFAHALGVAANSPGVDAERVRAAAERLVELGEEVHWEPSWFNAYGGVIEATVVTLEVLEAAESPRLDLVRRAAARQLMSTASSLGDWHNESGSAWMIRGLALLAAFEEVDSEMRTLTVEVDGDQVSEIVVDPRDPFLSAASLRLVDLADAVAQGAEVRVLFGGESVPGVSIVERVWIEPAANTASSISLEAGADGPSVRLAHELGPAVVRFWLPPHVRIDRDAVERAAAAGEIAGWTEFAGGGVEVSTLNASTEIPLRVVIAGEAEVRGGWVEPIGESPVPSAASAALVFER